MTTRVFPAKASGFTLIEMIVVVFLLAIAMLGILAVFDASARINKSEQQVADAQGSVRYATYQMTRIIRMAGSGGLYVRQAVLDAAPAGLQGIDPTPLSFDNVPDGATVMDLNSNPHKIRAGTDMIEVRGVILSPLYGLLGSPCQTDPGCDGGSDSLAIPATELNAILGVHINNDPNRRPQFDATYAYTNGVSLAHPMFVLVAGSLDQSSGCAPAPPPTPTPPPIATRYPQPFYNVALLTAPASGDETTLTFSTLSFTDSRAEQFNGTDPTMGGTAPAPLTNPARGGVLDDILFFIDNGYGNVGDSTYHPSNPSLAQAVRRGDSFDITTIADDVEDMQIAYGVAPFDTNVDWTVSPLVGGDQWTPNVQGESAADPGTFVQAPLTCPNLHAVMISLLAKSKDPDPTFKGSAATGFLMMNVPLSGGGFRRRW